MPQTTHCVCGGGSGGGISFSLISMFQVKTGCFPFIHIHVAVSVETGTSESSRHITRGNCVRIATSKWTSFTPQHLKSLKIIFIIRLKGAFGFLFCFLWNYSFWLRSHSSNKSVARNFFLWATQKADLPHMSTFPLNKQTNKKNVQS